MPDRQREHRSGAAIVVGVALLLPLLYVLSAGPAVWLMHRRVVSEGALEIVYQPLEWVADVCPPFFWLASRYIDLWDRTDAAAPPAPPISIPAPQPVPVPAPNR